MSQCYFERNGITYIDYKDIPTLEKFTTKYGRIQNRKHTGVCAKSQRQLQRAIKRARFMALMSYVKS